MFKILYEKEAPIFFLSCMHVYVSSIYASIYVSSIYQKFPNDGRIPTDVKFALCI